MGDLMNFDPSAIAPVHKLEGAALKKWRKSMERVVGQQVLFLLTLPFFLGMMIWRVGPAAYPLACMSSVVWLMMFVLAVYCANKQLRHCVEVTVAGDGLRLKSFWFNRKIPWGEIKDFYCVDDQEHVLQLKDDEQYFLSKDLTNSDSLVSQIQSNVPKPVNNYVFNTASPEEVTQGQKAAFFAIWVALVFSFLTPVLASKSILAPAALANIATSLAITLGAVLLYRACAKSFVHQIRVGEEGLALYCDSAEKRLRWNQVRSIDRIMWIVIIRHSDGVSFVPLFHFQNTKEIKRIISEQQERLKITMSRD